MCIINDRKFVNALQKESKTMTVYKVLTRDLRGPIHSHKKWKLGKNRAWFVPRYKHGDMTSRGIYVFRTRMAAILYQRNFFGSVVHSCTINTKDIVAASPGEYYYYPDDILVVRRINIGDSITNANTNYTTINF